MEYPAPQRLEKANKKPESERKFEVLPKSCSFRIWDGFFRDVDVGVYDDK